jgi:hypothetical protein
MATQVQWRGGSTAEHATFTGAAREVTVDTQKQTLVVHDGSTAGGAPLQKQYPPLGSAAAPTYTFTGDTNTGIYSPGADQVAVSTGGTGRLFVDANGNVGVGLSGPSYPLEVAAPADSTINITGGTSNVCRLFFSDTALARGFLNYAHADDSLHIGTAGTERLRIDSAGNVGIGTSSPSTSLHVIGGGKFASSTTSGSIVQAQNSDLSSLGYFGVEGSTGGVTLTGTLANSTFISSGASGTPLQFGTGGVIRSTLTSTGLGIGTASPASLLTSYAGNVSTLGAKASTGLLIENNGSVGNVSQIGLGYTFSSTNHPIAIAAVTTSGSGSTRADLVFATRDLTTDVAPTERARIDSSGNVGIGTTSPGSLLELSGSGSASELRLRSTDTSDAIIRSYVNSLEAGKIAFTSGRELFIETAGTERARIDSSGRLLVGTSSTSTNLRALIQATSANSTGGGNLYLARGESTPADGASLGYLGFSDSNHTSAAGLEAVRDGGTWTSGSSQPSRLVFSTTADGASSPTERMRISNEGLVATYGNSNCIVAASFAAAGTTDATFRGRRSATSTQTGVDTFIVYTNGNVVNTNNSYGAISDIKLKENIVDANSQWSDIKALQVRKYNFKEGQTHTQIGLVAQEVELVSPGLVSESPDRDEDGNDLGTVTKSVNYSVLYMKAVKALQEAMERIETLEARLTAAGI